MQFEAQPTLHIHVLGQYKALLGVGLSTTASVDDNDGILISESVKPRIKDKRILNMHIHVSQKNEHCSE